MSKNKADCHQPDGEELYLGKSALALQQTPVTRSRSSRYQDESEDYDILREPNSEIHPTARHYKISNESKFAIEGPELGDHTYEPEKVIDTRVSPEGIVEHLVKWKGQKLHLCQWLRDIDPELVRRYNSELDAGKTQSGKGAYAYKRALRREAKALQYTGASQNLRKHQAHIVTVPHPRAYIPDPIQTYSQRVHRFDIFDSLGDKEKAEVVRKRTSQIRRVESNDSSEDSGKVHSPRPMYRRHQPQYLPRFQPKVNQRFEAQVFKPVRPAFHKSRTLPPESYLITPLPTPLSPDSLGDEVSPFSE